MRGFDVLAIHPEAFLRFSALAVRDALANGCAATMLPGLIHSLV